MTRAFVERCTVVILFVLVLVVFSLAERDAKKLTDQYNNTRNIVEKVQKPHEYAASVLQPTQPASLQN